MAPPSKDGELSRTQLGRMGEAVAARYLQAKGYTILERNFRCGLGEIDIIAKQAGQLVFVEVKTRTTQDVARPADSVTAAKQERLAKAAEVYLLRKAKGEWRCRFDVVEVLMTPRGQVVQVDLVGGAFARPDH
jgi:putative endonuclease